MAELNGVNVEKLQGGLGRSNGNLDNHVAILLGGIPVGAVATAINNAGKGVVVTSLYEAEVLGINESLDANNNILAYDQIKNFFELAPEATLYLFNSDVEADLKGFLNYNKNIKGYALNVAFADNTVAEITKHQAIIDSFAAQNRLIDFAVIGLDGCDDFSINLFAQTGGNVSVSIACEKADGKVSTGAILGMLAIRRVNENVGSVDIKDKPLAKRGGNDYPLTDSKLSRWLTSYLSDGREVASVLDGELTSIISKGYIVAAGYEGYPGVYFENSYTCIERASDFAQIENNRVWNKAARLIRTTLLPRVKGVVKKDPTTGFIASTTVSGWKQLLNKALGTMVTNDEISGFEVDINPNQTVNATSPVEIKASIVADGIVHEFTVSVGLVNNL